MGVKDVAVAAVHKAENLIRWALPASADANNKKNLFLSGNFSPVSEESHETELSVQGSIPPSLSGAFIRNGPNPQHPPAGGYHWFDGDGMLHSLRLKDGKAVAYANHWVRTDRFQQERKLGLPVYTKIGDLQGAAGVPLAVIGVLKRKWQGAAQGTANTAVEYHAGRLLALHEGGVPFAVRLLSEGALESVGSETFGGKLAHPCTAHPKVCPVTGELLFFGYHVDKSIVDFKVANSKGEIVRSEEVPFRFPQMVHDFAITETYAVFMDLSLVFDPKVMAVEGKVPFTYDKSKGARFGLLRRGAAAADGASSPPVRWFSASGCYIFHTINAWDEDGGRRVKLLACRTEEFDLGLGAVARDPETGRFDADGWKGGNSAVYEYTFDLETGETREARAGFGRLLTPLPDELTGMDFPRIHPALTGRPTRFCYCAELSGPVTTGAAKVDLSTGDILGRVQFPPGCFGSGDPVFVPAAGAQSAWEAWRRRGEAPPAVAAGAVGAAEEDDGFLMTFVNNEREGNASELWIIDAKTMSPEPVARVSIPKRIPYGFHGTWVAESDIQGQLGGPLAEAGKDVAPAGCPPPSSTGAA